MFEQLRTLFPCEEPSDRPAQVTAGGTLTAPTAADHDPSPAPGTMEDKTPDWKRHRAVDELAAIVDDGLGQPTFMLGPDGRIVLWNEAMVALNGTPKKEEEEEEETRQHTENITESIECLQSQTDESVETAVDSRDRIEAVTDLIDDLLGVFELITDLVEEVADEQTDGIDGLLSHVEELYDGMADD